MAFPPRGAERFVTASRCSPRFPPLSPQAFTPVSVLLVSAAFGLKELTRKILFIVSLISFGVALASYGELDFEIWGFLVQVRPHKLPCTCAWRTRSLHRLPFSQALAICIESCRLVLVQKLLQGFGLDPIASLYYMAPVCLAINAVILLPVEGFQVFEDAVNLVGLPYLFFKCARGLSKISPHRVFSVLTSLPRLCSACLTFALNLASVSLIGKASGLVLTLAGVLKDVRLPSPLLLPLDAVTSRASPIDTWHAGSPADPPDCWLVGHPRVDHHGDTDPRLRHRSGGTRVVQAAVDFLSPPACLALNLSDSLSCVSFRGRRMGAGGCASRMALARLRWSPFEQQASKSQRRAAAIWGSADNGQLGSCGPPCANRRAGLCKPRVGDKVNPGNREPRSSIFRAGPPREKTPASPPPLSRPHTRSFARVARFDKLS